MNAISSVKADSMVVLLAEYGFAMLAIGGLAWSALLGASLEGRLRCGSSLPKIAVMGRRLYVLGSFLGIVRSSESAT